MLQKCKLFSFVFQLVYEAILSSARELGTLEDEEGNEVIDIPLVHVAHSRVQLRLRCFAQLVQVHPDLVPRLREIFREKESEVVSSCSPLNLSLTKHKTHTTHTQPLGVARFKPSVRFIFKGYRI